MPRLRPICFMVMPYGIKRTNAPVEQGVSEINFDALWDRALRPAIEELGYEPVRADQDVDALIIHEMLERLYFSDLVLADMTIPNGNVYYEVGIRHACRNGGCVLLAADWSKQLFDVAQMRTVRYPLAISEVDAAAAALVRDVLIKKIPPLVAGSSPMFQVLPGFPNSVDERHAKLLREKFDALNEFQGRMSEIRIAPPGSREEMASQLINDYVAGKPVSAAVAHGLFKLFEGLGAWQKILDLANKLPLEIAQQSNVVELVSLAKSKLGDHSSAIAELNTLIENFGPTSEREGLLGGRYKRLYSEAVGAEKPRWLNESIKHYELGMMMDLNDYFPASNLPRLYRLRGLKGDVEKAKAVAQLVYFSCQRARQRNASDEWLLPTLLGAAFDAADIDSAETLCAEIVQEGSGAWKLDTTIRDLELSLLYVEDSGRRDVLRDILEKLRVLL